MWASTKPSRMIPLTAITHFLPTADRQNRTRKCPAGRGAGTGGPVYRASASASSAPAFCAAVETSVLHLRHVPRNVPVTACRNKGL